METKFNLYQAEGLTLEGAVAKVLTARAEGNPVDLTVPSDQLWMDIDGSIKVQGERYELSDSGKVSISRLLGLDKKFTSKLSADTFSLVVNDLMRGRVKQLVLRCGSSDGVKYVRAVMDGRYGVLDDRPVLLALRSSCGGALSKFPVSLWVSEIGSSIRVPLAQLPSASDRFKVSMRYGFDLATSELIPKATWIRGLLIFDDRYAVVLPKALMLEQVAKVEDVFGLIAHMVEPPISTIDATVCAVIPDTLMNAGKTLADLDRRKLITLSEKNALTAELSGGKKGADGFAALANVDIPTIEFMHIMATFAATFDFYVKRTALEFIPNLWCSNRLEA